MHLENDELSVILMALEMQKEDALEQTASGEATESTASTLKMVECIQNKIKDGQINLSLEETQAVYFYVYIFHQQVALMMSSERDSDTIRYEKAANNILHGLEEQFNMSGIKISDFMTMHSSLSSFNRAAQRYNRKIGRNDPCPCGSGKQYKKCCGKPF